jgi:hypothetical protein
MIRLDRGRRCVDAQACCGSRCRRLLGSQPRRARYHGNRLATGAARSAVGLLRSDLGGRHSVVDIQAMPVRDRPLRVGVRRPGSGSFGELTLAAGRATLRSWPSRHVLAVHTSDQVLVARPRLDLFARRTAFVLLGSQGPYGVQAGLYPVRVLAEAFAAAGFKLSQDRPLFEIFPRPPF